MRTLRIPSAGTLGLAVQFGRGRLPPPDVSRPRLQETQATHGRAPEPARLLLVEDEPLHRRMVRMVLTTPGLSVLEVESGEAAIDLLAIRRFDLVLLDASLPGMSSYETLSWLRSGPAEWRDIPVMALAAREDERLLGPMRAIGLDDWAQKPVDRADLMRRLGRILPGLSDAGT